MAVKKHAMHLDKLIKMCVDNYSLSVTKEQRMWEKGNNTGAAAPSMVAFGSNG